MRNMLSAGCVAFGALAGAVGAACGAAEPVVVIDRLLKGTTGELVSLNGEGATLRTGDKEVKVERPVALVAASLWGPERAWPGLPKEETLKGTTVELTDGSVLRGDLLAGKGDGLVLVHKRLGKVEFPLDSLAALTVQGAGPGDRSSRKKADAVQLANGDLLEGFVESIGHAKEGAGLAVTIEREKAKTQVPLERVAWVTLNGGAAAKPGRVVWLGTGGERTAAAEFSIADKEARVVRAKGSPAALIEAGNVQAALLEPTVVMPLSSCAALNKLGEVGAELPLGVRDLTITESGDVPAATQQWQLPAGAVRISGWAVLPEECRRWGDCEVTVSVFGDQQSLLRPVRKFTLNGATPVVALDADLPTDGKEKVWLSVKVGEGKNGPVQDRVVLRRVLVGLK